MTSHTREDIDEIIQRKLIGLFSEMRCASRHIQNSHEGALRDIRFLAERGDPLLLLQLIRHASALPPAHDDHPAGARPAGP